MKSQCHEDGEGGGNDEPVTQRSSFRTCEVEGSAEEEDGHEEPVKGEESPEEGPTGEEEAVEVEFKGVFKVAIEEKDEHRGYDEAEGADKATDKESAGSDEHALDRIKAATYHDFLDV